MKPVATLSVILCLYFCTACNNTTVQITGVKPPAAQVPNNNLNNSDLNIDSSISTISSSGITLRASVRTISGAQLANGTIKLTAGVVQ